MTADRRFWLVPAAGVFVPDPDDGDRAIPPTGAWVAESSFYRRFIARGEATRGDPPAKTTAKTAKTGGDRHGQRSKAG